jgi:hypothetical protein
VSFDKNSNTYLMREKGANQIPITLGEMMTGGAWGQRYRLDGTVPKSIRKRYLVAEARRQLMDALNQQIAVAEAQSLPNREASKGRSYAAIAARKEKPLIEHPEGVIAEHLVAGLMTRLAIDHRLPFEILPTDAHADVEYKIDFIIRVKEKDQGVSVDTHEGHNIGIQFTTNTTERSLKHKQEQIVQVSESLAAEEGKTVERIVVVSVPVDEVRVVLKEWQTNQKHAVGGPDKLIAPDMQEKIFKGVLHDVFTEEAVDKMWAEVQGSSVEKIAARG